MKIELVTIGDELLLGQIVNSNIALIGSRLLKIGLKLSAQSSIPDELTALEAALREALNRSDVVLTTGGLGPTADDKTKDALCSIFECKAQLNQAVLDDLVLRFGQKLSETIRSQAVVPAKAQIIENSVGTAPGFIFGHGRKQMIVLPGPPHELTRMRDKYVLPLLAKRADDGKVFRQKVFRTTGVGESDVDRRMRQLMKSIKSVGYGLMARPHQVDIRLTCVAESAEQANQLLQNAGESVQNEFGNKIFGGDDEKIEAVVGKMLKQRKLTIALAESCTGGLITSRITDIPGSSEYLNGTVVSYTNQWKRQLLDLPEDTLKEHGAVSEESARAMAEGVRRIGASDLGLAVTGIAGPTGGSAEKPVGLVYMALSDRETTIVKKNNFRGDREMVKFRSSQVALDMVRLYLLSL